MRRYLVVTKILLLEDYMTLSKRIAALERKVHGDGRKVVWAIAQPGGFQCSGANVTTWAEYEAFVEETKRNGDYDFFYQLNYGGSKPVDA